MKRNKILSSLLCAALVLTLSGCTDKPDATTATTVPTTQETTLETTLETTTETTTTEYVDTSVTYHAPMSAISMPVVAETSQAADGTTLFTYTYQGLSLFLHDAQVADKIFLDYQNRLDSLHATARDLNNAAAAAYSSKGTWDPYEFKVQYMPMRFDEMVLSLYAAKTVFDGNAHGNYTNFFITYDLLTGQALGIRDILVADYSADDLVELIVRELSKQEEENMLFPDYAQLVSDMFSTNRPVENWYFDKDGLSFFFNPYEIAPYGAGIIVAKIPYDSLGGLLKDSYFPAEAVSFAGTPKLVDFNAANTEEISNFAELILDTDGKEHLLYVEGTLLNVRISTDTCTVFAATSISKGDAVLIQCSEDLLLSYESNGVVFSQVLPVK